MITGRFAAPWAGRNRRVVLSLRRPLHDGTTAVAFSPMELSKWLAAIVPPPKRRSLRYFGVLAAGAVIRAKVIRKPGERRRRACVAAPIPWDADLDRKELGRALRDELGFNPLALGPPPMPERTHRLDWASLLQRVFFVLVGIWSLFNVRVDLVPVLFILAGLALLFPWIRRAARQPAR